MIEINVLRYPGAKFSIAEKIIELIPPHKIYVEPFMGSAAIFLNKGKVNTEIINDLNSEVVNLFRVIREEPEKLALKIELTPYSREEYLNSYSYSEIKDDIERARQFLIRSNMAIGGSQNYRSGWRHAGPVLGRKAKERVTGQWSKLPGQILNISRRLKEAEIENVDGLSLIEKYNHKDTFLYIDPPYLISTRKQKYYDCEMCEEEEHKNLLNLIIKSKSKILISGYDNELYNNMLVGWDKLVVKAQAEQGQNRNEVLWANYELPKQLSFEDI